MKRLLSIVLSVLLVVAVSSFAFAEETKSSMMGKGMMKGNMMGKEGSMMGMGMYGAPRGFYGGGFGGWGGYGWSGGGTDIRTDTIVSVQTLLYDLSKNELVWAGQSETMNPSKAESFMRDLLEAVGDELQKAGLVGPAK